MPAPDPAELCHTALGLGFNEALLLVSPLVLATSLLLWAAGRWPPGSGVRVGAAAVAVAVNFALPALFCRWEDTTTIVLMSFNFMWISSFKAVSWAFNRGALCTQPFTFPQFLVVYAAPVTPVATHSPAAAPHKAEPSPATDAEPAGPASSESTATSTSTTNGTDAAAGAPAGVRKGRLAEDAGSTGNMLKIWAAKAAFLACMVQLLQHKLPGFVESFALAMSLYALLSMIMDGPAAAVIGLTGLRVSPHFDTPWLATSVVSFWSKRWDLAAGNTLRQLVYDSVCDGSLLPPATPRGRPSARRQALGSFASFAASGLIHECMFWYLTGRTTRGVWLSYFLVQVPAIILERAVLAWLKRRKVMVPTLLRIIYTVSFETWTAQHLFFGPAKASGVSDSIVHNVAETVTALARRLEGVRRLHAA